jgi:hypothetical protein
MLDQTALQISLLNIRAERKKIEAVGIFNDLLSQLRLLGWQRAGEICECAALFVSWI